MKIKIFFIKLFKILLVTCCILLICEIILRSGLTLLVRLRLVPNIGQIATSVRLGSEKQFWENYFLRMHKGNEFVYGKGLYNTHETLGWTLKPGACENVNGYQITVNQQGHRGLTPSANNTSKTNIVIVGDSFTLSEEADDAFAWPSLMQSIDTSLNVLNLGVGGYGLDQMFLQLRIDGLSYKPDIVIMAFISDDLYRTMLSFRDFKKPLFIEKEGNLQLTNVPIGSVEQVVAEIRQKQKDPKRFLSKSYLVNSVKTIVNCWLNRGYPYPVCIPEYAVSEIIDRNLKIAKKAQEISNAGGAKFFLLYLPTYNEIYSNVSSLGELFIKTAHESMSTINGRPYYQELVSHKNIQLSQGHPRNEENRIIADLVLEHIAKTR